MTFRSLKKFFLPLVLFFVLFSITGCDSENMGIAFSTAPFTKDVNYKPQNTFHKGDRIYFAVYNGEGFKTRLVKYQVIKKENEKSEFWGYEYLYNKTVELKNKNAFSDYVVIHNKGYYVFQVFDFTDFQKPVIIGIINVVD